jgi:predicted DNA-binding ribbon-helix-helix protein
VEKRSLTISGHRTSIALEPEFWAGIGAMARARNISATLLIREIDAGGKGVNLSSAVRVAVLAWYRDRPAPG